MMSTMEWFVEALAWELDAVELTGYTAILDQPSIASDLYHLALAELQA